MASPDAQPGPLDKLNQCAARARSVAISQDGTLRPPVDQVIKGVGAAAQGVDAGSGACRGVDHRMAQVPQYAQAQAQRSDDEQRSSTPRRPRQADHDHEEDESRSDRRSGLGCEQQEPAGGIAQHGQRSLDPAGSENADREQPQTRQKRRLSVILDDRPAVQPVILEQDLALADERRVHGIEQHERDRPDDHDREQQP
jgi:hypothetical protein